MEELPLSYWAIVGSQEVSICRSNEKVGKRVKRALTPLLPRDFQPCKLRKVTSGMWTLASPHLQMVLLENSVILLLIIAFPIFKWISTISRMTQQPNGSASFLDHQNSVIFESEAFAAIPWQRSVALVPGCRAQETTAVQRQRLGTMVSLHA